jgi:hypothetical protein
MTPGATVPVPCGVTASGGFRRLTADPSASHADAKVDILDGSRRRRSVGDGRVSAPLGPVLQMAQGAETCDRNRWSVGLTLVALLALSGCVAPWLDTKTENVLKFQFEPTGTGEARFTVLEQSGEVVSGLFEFVETDQEVRYETRNRRIPTMYAASDGVGTFSPGMASFTYLLILPLSVISTLTGNGSGFDPVEWKTVEGRPRRVGKTGIVSQRSYPISAAGVEWELDLAGGPVAGLVETDSDGRFTISFEQSWGAIRSSLDRMVSAELRLEAVGGGGAVSVPIDLLRVDEAIMRSGQ